MQVVILAAGSGTRLFPITNFLPKSMTPVGDKPCIRWIVERLNTQGFEDITLRVNTKDVPIFKHEFRDMNLCFSSGTHPLGSAGELLDMYEKGELREPDILVHYGDELTPIPLKKLVRFHEVFEHPLVTLALVQGMKLDVGTVSIDGEGTVLAFEEKPPLDKKIWAGICVINQKIFKGSWLKPNTDLGSDVFPKLITRSKKPLLKGAVLGTKWLDIGTVSHWEWADKLAKEGKLECE